jgi:hypothetical protein
VIALPAADGFAPGTWRFWVFGPARILGAAVTCPQCRRAFSIGGGQVFGSCHTVAADGTISPSVVCPGCGWHVMAKLDGWQP